MVKHHKKKKQKISKKKEEPQTGDLNRFAGSSEEESDHEIEPKVTKTKRKIDDVPVEENENKKIKKEIESKQDEKDEDISSDDDDDNEEVISSDSSTSESSESEEEPIAKDEGMANVMSRILYNHNNANPAKTTILSKTTTPLQKKLLETKKEESRIKARRKQLRKEHLSFVHIPQINNVDEIQQEREHRRVATRGVVALFNAISKHQNKIVEDEKKEEVVTKERFLDMLKQTALEGDAAQVVEKNEALVVSKKQQEEEYQPKKGWKALQDDYLMGSAIKDWDKELSDDGSDRGGAIEMDDDF